jgi:hypothetical protein
MITISSWWILAYPVLLFAGMVIGAVSAICIHDDDARGGGAADPARGRDELEPEMPEWDDDSLALLREPPARPRPPLDELPGETTGPFTITDLPGPAGRASDTGGRAGEHHAQDRPFSELPLPDPAVLEQEWSWGHVAWQIVQFREWLDSGAWDLETVS